tara:strand:- start:294 stop:644 length:351 start_codon:yes stop_codon:yes gene_type:complete
MRVLLLLVFVISFSAKILGLDAKDPNLSEIDAKLTEISISSDQLDVVFREFFGLEAKSKVENETIISVVFENVQEEDALLVLQRSQEVKVLKLHKASIISGESEKSYNLEIIYVAG